VAEQGREPKSDVQGETLQALADARGISLETLVNVWLTEKVLELA
jgi:hypothetical protein